jgi:hypothetical protein
MQSFCDAFRRNADGSWVCVEHATLQGPGIRIDALPGQVYKRGLITSGLDLAEFLEIEQAVRREADAARARLRSRYGRRRAGPAGVLLAA